MDHVTQQISPPRYETLFSDSYLRFVSVAREGTRPVSEMVIQAIWYDQLFPGDALVTTAGQAIHIHSPGWWNRSEGPDFRGAQIQFGDTIRSGDIEIHLDHAAWKQHGHHRDPRYDQVLLVVVLETLPPSSQPVTSSGRAIPCLLLGNYVDTALLNLPELGEPDEDRIGTPLGRGYCAAIAEAHGVDRVRDFVTHAAESRMLAKARAIRERAERAGFDQAVYESFMTACGYARYKQHFQLMARQLPYERVVQLARNDAFLLEAAFLQLAGLLPETLPEATDGVPHHTRLRGLYREHLSGMRSLPLAWKRVGVRPNNYPERRLSGAARFLARTARTGLWETIEAVWRLNADTLKQRRAFEDLFPVGIGFWAEHCTWTGQRLKKPVATLGQSRIRAIVGNVFLPATLAYARQQCDRKLEEQVFALFRSLPKEPGNRIVHVMLPRVFGPVLPKRIDFRLQQGLLQIYQDWCESNPSCRNCPVIGHLDREGKAAIGAAGP
ncbi:MAG: DUF2851 family protein [Candidatus Hydrogenedentes bacterium]|nr:DUF2851 family protein [Candidatus Hydrogenedentota bacterium]